MVISIDFGDTLADRKKPKIPVGKGYVYELFEGAHGVLAGLAHTGDELALISKISLGDEARISLNLFHHNIVPYIIDPEKVRFCYSREAKGPIAEDLRSEVHIDDRVDCLNAVHSAGVKHKILFVGGFDRREEEIPFTFGESEGLYIARTWDEILSIIHIIRSLS